MGSSTFARDAAGSPPAPRPNAVVPPGFPAIVIDLSSSDSDSEAEDYSITALKRSRVLDEDGIAAKKARLDPGIPLGFLDPLPPEEQPQTQPAPAPCPAQGASVALKACRQFWKAGDFEGSSATDSAPVPGAGMDHVRVHPKFLHSNATSHKWALGALAELLDNSLDEVCHGAMYVNIDMLKNKKDGSKMLLVEDNGGGMDPDKMRQCMSLGYSLKSKIANTIGQYGNGFKTSTMRLGADVIVFSRSCGKDGKSPTQSIGLLSYSYLRNTGKEDIVVPMLDYEKLGQVWKKMSLSSAIDWIKNLETIVDWSPYSSEADLLQQFGMMSDQGTRVVIYNLWEDDQGKLELDFDADGHDIQVRGVNRDEKNIEMARKFPNSRHFLTYRHSLRSYASILYLRLPPGFRMILRGKEIEHHNVVTDMMMKQEVTYRPMPNADGAPKDPNMVAVVTVGFVRDAKHHIDVQGFNVYHKNRLIKPFWRVWNPPGSDGRGVIGVLEANFVEPAHDKQDFERTIVLSRLEARLIQMQKTYWSTNCHKIGYAPRRNKKLIQSEDRESSPESSQPSPPRSRKSTTPTSKSKDPNYKGSLKTKMRKDGHLSSVKENASHKFGENSSSTRSRLHQSTRDDENSDSETDYVPSERLTNGSSGRKATVSHKSTRKEYNHVSLTSPGSVSNGTKENHISNGNVGAVGITTRSQSMVSSVMHDGNENNPEKSDSNLKQLKAENETLKERLRKTEESMSHELLCERDKNKSLAAQLEAAEKRLQEANKELEALIDIFSEERGRRDREEDNLRRKLKDANALIQKLQDQMSSS